MPRFIVIEGACSKVLDRAVAEFARPVRWDWQGAPGRLCVGTVATGTDGAHVVAAALAGADVVVDCRMDRDDADLMCDDLRRLGALDHRIIEQGVVVLDVDQRALLTRIAAGRSVGQAATATHLSRRTADRRLAAVRRALSADSTLEAALLAVRLGLIRPSDRGAELR
jgi:hypothetical protein